MTLMTSSPRLTRIHRYLLGGTAAVLLSVCAGVTGSLIQPVSAQTPKQTQSGNKQESRTDLVCTYHEKGVGFPGTCGRDKQDKTKYVCYKDGANVSQPQIGCERKVLKAEQADNK